MQSAQLPSRVDLRILIEERDGFGVRFGCSEFRLRDHEISFKFLFKNLSTWDVFLVDRRGDMELRSVMTATGFGISWFGTMQCDDSYRF